MANDKEKDEDKKDEEEIPDLWFIFDERGEYHADVANKAIMVKRDEQHDDIMEFVKDLGKVQKARFNSIVLDVDVDEALDRFEQEGYIVTKADSKDFAELEKELDKLMTVEGGESTKYK